MQYMTRTFNYTVATMGTLSEDKDGNPVVITGGQLVIDGEADKAKALKIAKKSAKDPEALIVIKVESKTELRGMPVMADARTPQPPVVDLTTPN